MSESMWLVNATIRWGIHTVALVGGRHATLCGKQSEPVARSTTTTCTNC